MTDDIERDHGNTGRPCSEVHREACRQAALKRAQRDYPHVSVDGVVYANLSIACRTLNLSRFTLRRRLRSTKPEDAEVFYLSGPPPQTPKKKGLMPSAERREKLRQAALQRAERDYPHISVGGVVYVNVTRAAKALGRNAVTLGRQARSNKEQFKDVFFVDAAGTPIDRT